MAEEDVLPEPDRVEGHPHPRETLRLYGQQSAERAFLDAWTGGRLHHAWLLRGPQGIGKATLAYRIARALIAQPPDQGVGLFGDGPGIPETLDAPANCPIHARIVARSEPRLFVLNRRWNPDTKRVQAQIPVESVREVRRFLSLSAADGGWRVVVVDSADEMNRSSANALLKFLEEPPADTLFLLISHAPAGLLPTIRSRCRTLDLGLLLPENLRKALQDAGADVPTGAEEPLAELSGGSVGQALRLVSGEGLALYARIVGMFGEGRRIDRNGLLQLAEACAGRQGADRYATTLAMAKTLTARLARTSATGHLPAEAAKGEHRLMSTIATNPAQGALWAEALAKISATTRHAVAVNLDPAQCVIDTFLELDATLGRANPAAA